MDVSAMYPDLYPRLFGIAYRMTGSVRDAEDIVQEAWLRRLQQDDDTVRSDVGWLIRAVSSIAIDYLRRAKRARPTYGSPWLPEPLADERFAPDHVAATREAIGFAVLLLLDRLTPEQRVVWVLRESVGLPYEDIAAALGKTPAACRQIARRASIRIAPEVSGPERGVISTTMLDQFVAALGSGNVAALMALLHEDAVWIGDGGTERLSIARPVIGADRIARGLTGLLRKQQGRSLSLQHCAVNGGPALVITEDGEIDSVWVVLTTNGRISHVLNQRNPRKFAGITGHTASLANDDRPEANAT